MISIRTLVLGFLFTAIVSVAVAITVVGENIAAAEVKAQSSNFLRALSVDVAEDLDSGLYERYRQIEALAEHPAIRGFHRTPAEARRAIERFVSRDGLYSWLAIADPSGKVVMANRGLLEGLDVASRPWFKPSLKEPYVGDVHPAVLLAKLIPTADGMAPYFVDIGFPILGDRGQTLGVLIAHVNWRMANDIIETMKRQTPEYGGTDVLVVSSNGIVLHGPESLRGQPLDIRAINGVVPLRLDDGREYMVSAARATHERAYPGLNWGAVVRVPVTEVDIYARVMRWKMLLATLMLIGLFAIFGMAATNYVVAPIQALSSAVREFDVMSEAGPVGLGQEKAYIAEIRSLGKDFEDMADRINVHTAELQVARLDVLNRLAIAGEYRDNETGLHVQRISRYAELLARLLGWDPLACHRILYASPLHDIGKIGIPDSILLKPGPLTPEEWSVMKSHPTVGAEILSNGYFDMLEVARDIALCHHERWDGKGYPRGLTGEEIPEVARIVSVVDVFDALTTDRPYKKAWTLEAAVAEIEKNAGTQFDPRIAGMFCRNIAAFDKIRRDYLN